MDAVYDWSRFDSLPQAYEWILAGIVEDPQLAGQLVDSTTKYGNQATIRRIGYLLDTLDQPPRLLGKLQSALNRSKALIPWIAGNPKRGRVNRAWGVIVNDAKYPTGGSGRPHLRQLLPTDRINFLQRKLTSCCDRSSSWCFRKVTWQADADFYRH